MGDKGGKKDKEKSQQQHVKKSQDKEQERLAKGADVVERTIGATIRFRAGREVQVSRPATAPAITSSQALLTDAWTADVSALQAALGRIKTGTLDGCDCRVTFFEIPGDRELHVSVTHQYPTDEGVGTPPTPHGIVADRTFARMPRYQVLRQIRDMVFPADS